MQSASSRCSLNSQSNYSLSKEQQEMIVTASILRNPPPSSPRTQTQQNHSGGQQHATVNHHMASHGIMKPAVPPQVRAHATPQERVPLPPPHTQLDSRRMSYQATKEAGEHSQNALLSLLIVRNEAQLK